LTEILYRSPALEVRRVPAGNGRRQVVTFDSYHEPPGFDRHGFGEAFFHGEGITAIHVMSYGNDWFQYAEMQSVLSLVREACAGAERLMTYGSSMGGYAALRFAAAIGARSALALSPQYSIDRRKAPFETRWASDRRRIRFIKALEGRIAQVPLMVLAYDFRNDIDRGHVFRLGTFTDIEQIPLLYAGHPVGPFLNDVGLLRPLVLSVLDGGFDQEYFRATARSRSRRSPHWLANVAERHPRAHGNRAIALARRAVSLAPDRPNLHDVLARQLAAAGRYAEAIEAHQRAIALQPIADYQWGLSRTLHAAGDRAGALSVAERLQRLAPSTAGYHAWAAKLRETQGDLPGAMSDMREALRHDRSNWRYRAELMTLRWQLWFARRRRQGLIRS
jgi:tetratricopeptide (TPR) repeat protein